ncbi:hypothetical protein M3Y97_00955200 [Aphelenchoides bicaudatus]|nr:hypothetical protein M3Y97_00955200 [Aphelenchoides bicaudatus]
MLVQKDLSGTYLAKTSVTVGYNLTIGILRLILLIAISLLPPLQIGTYSSVIAFTNTQQYSSLPLKIFVPADSPAVTVMGDISYLLSSRVLGWILVGHFAFQVVAADFFSDGLKKKAKHYLYPMYLHLISEFFFLMACCVAGTKFSHNMFFPLPASTWYGAIGHYLCGFLIFLTTFTASAAYIQMLETQLKQEVASIEKKENVDLNHVVVNENNAQTLCKKLEDIA